MSELPIATLTFSEAGGHAINEDAFAIGIHPADDSYLICALADGQGGRAGGREAAQLACRSTFESAINCSPQALLDPRTWPKLLRHADEAVRADSQAGFTTLVGLCLKANTVCGASSGDSAAWIMSAGTEQRLLTENQCKNPPVGCGAALFVPFESKLTAPWTVLLLSDGVWKYVRWEVIESIAREQRGETLLSMLQERGRLLGSGAFQDDFTVVVLNDRSHTCN